MTFIWPKALWLLLALPPLIFLYVKGFRSGERLFARYPALMQASRPRTVLGKINRLVPPVLFFMGLAVLIVGLARPAATITLASQRGTLVMALDVSGSMRAEDVHPTRITAAQ